jgi:gamma-glutamyltranspeptidase/glutathione hydrolase
VGVVALQALGVLGRFAPPPPGAFDGRGWADPGWIHLGLEASRLALEERDAWVTDQDAVPAGAIETMLSGERLDALAARIDPRRARRPAPLRSPADGGTVYLATADRWGGVVSLLQSNYLGFGSGLVDPETGIAFQDRGAFFRLDPASANALAPGKRTLHTLTPGLLLRDGRPWLAHGAMGGEIQPQVFLQVVSAVVDGRSDVATAVAAPRWAAQVRRHLGPPEATDLESRFAPHVPADLAAMGHDVTLLEPWSSSMGHAHALQIVTDEDGDRSFATAADPRSEGSAEAW